MEPVFELIKSMNQGEKRYFKRVATLRSESGENNYVKMFDAIDKAKNYDEKKLVAQFGKKFFAQYKRQLFVKVLEVIRTMRDAHSAEVQVRNLINEAEILSERGLLKSSAKHLNLAKQKAKEQEFFLEQVRGYKAELSRLSRTNDVTKLRNQIEEYKAVNNQVAKQIENQLAYQELYLNLTEINQKIELVRTVKEQQLINSILTNDLLADENKATNNLSKNYFHYVQGLAHYFMGDFRSSAKCFVRQQLLFESVGVTDVDEVDALKIYGNVCLLSLKTTDQTTFEITYQKLKQLTVVSNYGKQYHWYLCYFLRLMSFDDNDLSAASAFIEENQKEVKELHKWIRENETMYVEYCYSVFKTVEIHLLSNEPRKALRSINDFLNHADSTLKQDTYCLARIINLLIHLELENVDLLENEMKSTLRFLSQHDRVFGFESSVIEFLKKAINQPANSSFKPLLTQLKKEWINLHKDPLEKQVFTYFNFEGWLDKQG